MVLARAPSGYEAAAELLAARAEALVVDLRLLGGKHLRLLEIARTQGVEILAVGSLPIGMTAEDLSGVRLISRRDLGGALAALARSSGGGGAGQAIAPEAPVEPIVALPESPPVGDVEWTAGGGGADEPDQSAEVLAGQGLPVEIGQALQGVAQRAGGSQTRRSDADDDEALQAPARDVPAGGRSNGGAACVEGQGQCLLTPEELSALLGDR